MNVRDLFNIEGKVALVTGGSRGLGMQIAQALCEMGCKVAITARKADGLEATRAHFKAQGFDILAMVNDLTRTEEIPSLVDAVLARFGPIDILVNNAGASWAAPAEAYPDHAWHKVMDLNVDAVFFLTRKVGRRCMIPRSQGKIINIASVAGLRGSATTVTTLAYNTSKGALVNFTRALASEWGKYNINVNAICPGFFPSKLSAGLLEQVHETVINRAPLHRIGGDDDLKGAAVFLALEASRHITGQNLAVDGGMSSV